MTVSAKLIEIGARAIAESQGYDPDELAPMGVMCTGKNKPVPWWRVFAEQSEHCLTAALSDQVVVPKELTLVRSQLAECHKEIFKLREALLSAPASTSGEVE